MNECGIGWEERFRPSQLYQALLLMDSQSWHTRSIIYSYIMMYHLLLIVLNLIH
jgi:hypothetical protein